MQEKCEAGGTSTREVPPASFMLKNPLGLVLAREGVGAHSTARGKPLADARLGKPQQQPHRYQ